MSRKPSGGIVVIGSINMDLVSRVRVMPKPGETVLGGNLQTIPGGKGANQAVAAARIADGRLPVRMIGRVGEDDFGRTRSGLANNGVDVKHVQATPGVPSGVAMITVDDAGGNSIVVAPGANHRLTPADIDAAEKVIRSAAVVVMQLEIPLATVKYAIKLCERWGVYTILDPAPAQPLPRDVLAVDLLSPNEFEAATLLKRRRGKPADLASALINRGAKAIALKLGAKGSFLATAERGFAVQSFDVTVVDTTAAGDAFVGALAVGKALSLPIEQAMLLASAAGSLACTKAGAQPSLPTRRAVERMINLKDQRRRGVVRTGTRA